VYGELLDELYANASAFVLPSSLEGLPLTLLEAASHGTPVVVSDIGPNLEIVVDDGPGHRVFTSGDEHDLRATLLRRALDPEAERRGASELRDRVLATFDWSDATERTEAVYSALQRNTELFSSR
jgi:glycosyltransferase involved in cell wall biosynthesis